jgi:TM2 domain-containing membrane protein YozV
VGFEKNSGDDCMSQMPPPVPPQYQSPYQTPRNPAEGKKIAAGVCAIVLGSLGVHKFILGYTGAGIVMLLVTLLTFGAGAVVMHIIGIIEGITYLTKSDEEFYHTYILNRKPWF